MQYYSFASAEPLIYDICGNLRSTGGFLHHRRSFDRWVFIYVKTGGLHLCLEGEEFTVSSGEYVFLPPCREHFGSHPSQGHLSYLWVHFTLPGDTNLTSLPDASQEGAFSTDTCKDTVSFPDASSGRDCYLWPQRSIAQGNGKIPLYFTELLELSRQPHAYPSSMPSCLLTLLLMQVSREYRESLSAKEHPLPAVLNQITLWMRNNLDQDITMLSAATRFDYNPDYLASLFRKHFHMSFTRSLNRMRIEAAKTMLASQNCSIKEAAFSCGFSDEKYFMKVFREVVGMTPTGYKNTYFKYKDM